MWNTLRQFGWLAVIPSWISAVTFWKKVVAFHWLAAPILVAVLTIWATLTAQRIWRQGVLQKWCKDVLDFANGINLSAVLDFRAPIDRALYVRGFIRVPKDEKPPDPMFKGTRSGAYVQRPWRRFVPKNAGDLWVTTSFAYPDPASGIYVYMPSDKVKTWGEQYSIDAKTWRADNRQPTDRYIRYREPTKGNLSDPIVLGARASNRSPQPEWLRLVRTAVRGGHTEKIAIPPMKLSAVKELRVVVQSYGSKFVTAESTLSAIEQLKPIAPDSQPDMTRLICTFHERAQSNVLEAVVRSPIYHNHHDGLRFAVDFIGDPNTGVVDTVAVEGAVPLSNTRYHDIATVYFR